MSNKQSVLIISVPFTGTVTSSLVNATMNELNDNEAYMAIVTGALEAMLTNYDKRIRPGYGGKPKNKELFANPFPYGVLFVGYAYQL